MFIPPWYYVARNYYIPEKGTEKIMKQWPSNEVREDRINKLVQHGFTPQDAMYMSKLVVGDTVVWNEAISDDEASDQVFTGEVREINFSDSGEMTLAVRKYPLGIGLLSFLGGNVTVSAPEVLTIQ